MRVAFVGLGSIGALIVRVVSVRPDVMIVGAVDVAADKVGRELAEVVGLEEETGVLVQDTIPSLLDVPPDVAIVATTSVFSSLVVQVRPLLEAGIRVLTTCEEAVFPHMLYPDLSREVDSLARVRDTVLLGVGVNPGYVMDYWPATVAAAVPAVSAVRVQRRVNLSERRARLQQKLGAGLTPAEAQARIEQGALGHVGLTVSAHLLASALGWMLTDVEETCEVLVSTEPVTWYQGTLEPGRVKGLRQVLRGYVANTERIHLQLEMALGLENPGDTVKVEGPVSVEACMTPISGDWATASIVANALPRVIGAAPGLRTVLEIAPLVGQGI